MRSRFIPWTERRHPFWPGDAKLAVAVHIAIEDWDPDLMAKTGHGPRGANAPINGVVDLSTTSAIDYGFRVGLPRLMEIIQGAGVVPAAFVNRTALQRRAEDVALLAAVGVEFVGHGLDQNVNLSNLPSAEFAEVIRGCREASAQIGVDLHGWSSPGTRESVEGLAELAAQDFTFHVGLHADELPYRLEFDDGSSLIEIGPAHQSSGQPWWDLGPGGVRRLLEAWADEATDRPLLVPLSFHPHLDGRPEVADDIRSTLAWLRGRDDTWVTHVGEVAEWMASRPRET